MYRISANECSHLYMDHQNFERKFRNSGFSRNGSITFENEKTKERYTCSHNQSFSLMLKFAKDINQFGELNKLLCNINRTERSLL